MRGGQDARRDRNFSVGDLLNERGQIFLVNQELGLRAAAENRQHR